MKKIRNKNLFTLLEVLVSMGVFSLLMLALMQFFSAAQGVWEKSGSKAELFDSSRIASQLLTDDLTSAFYGDEDHDMSQYNFYQSSSSRLTFATQRSGGLTEVDYNWNQTDLRLEIRELPETDASATVGAAGWVTYPSDGWISNVQGKTATSIAENILKFEVSNFYYNNSFTAPTDNRTKNRPPAIVMVTFAVLSSTGYEKLDTIIRPGVSGSTDEQKETQVKAQIKTYFDEMLPATDPKDKFKDTAVPESGSDKPAKEILLDNVQFYKLIIPIER